MEAPVKRTTPTAHPSDANMDPEGARKSLGPTRCASSLKRQKEECPLVGPRTPRTPNQNHTKTVAYLMEKDKETQEVRVLNMPEASPGFGGGKLPEIKQKMGNKETTRKMKYDGWRRR